MKEPKARAISPALSPGVRQGAWLFTVLGLVGVAGFLLPGGAGYHKTGAIVAGGMCFSFGLILLTRLASLLTGYRALLLPGFALAIGAVSSVLGLMPPVTVGPTFVVVYLWVGRWHPPGTGLRFAPVGIAAYLAPYAFGLPNKDGAIAAVAMVMALSVVAAEILARQTYKAQEAHERQLEALEALARASRTDDLTGLGNRRLGNQMLECLNHGDALVLLDLDHFKTVNDRFGHTRGDQLLQEFGEFIQGHMREPEAAARMGGEEFLVVLTQTTAEAALAFANRLVAEWASTGPVATISAGVALHTHAQGPSQTYTDADTALYAAKAGGRNRAVLAGKRDATELSALEPARHSHDNRGPGAHVVATATVPSPRN